MLELSYGRVWCCTLVALNLGSTYNPGGRRGNVSWIIRSSPSLVNICREFSCGLGVDLI